MARPNNPEIQDANQAEGDRQRDQQAKETAQQKRQRELKETTDAYSRNDPGAAYALKHGIGVKRRFKALDPHTRAEDEEKEQMAITSDAPPDVKRKPGTYSIEPTSLIEKMVGYAFNIQQDEKGQARAVPPPKNARQFNLAFESLCDWYGAQGATTITIEWAKPESFNKEWLMMAIKIAQEKGFAVDFGPNTQAYISTLKSDSGFLKYIFGPDNIIRAIGLSQNKESKLGRVLSHLPVGITQASLQSWKDQLDVNRYIAKSSLNHGFDKFKEKLASAEKLQGADHDAKKLAYQDKFKDLPADKRGKAMNKELDNLEERLHFLTTAAQALNENISGREVLKQRDQVDLARNLSNSSRPRRESLMEEMENSRQDVQLRIEALKQEIERPEKKAELEEQEATKDGHEKSYKNMYEQLKGELENFEKQNQQVDMPALRQKDDRLTQELDRNHQQNLRP